MPSAKSFLRPPPRGFHYARAQRGRGRGVQEAAEAKALRGHAVVRPVKIRGRNAHFAISGASPEFVVIDTFGRVVLIVEAERLATAERVAAPMLR